MGVRKKTSRGAKGPPRRGVRSDRTAGRQTVALLAFDPFTPGSEHPEWVGKDFPDYVQHPHEDLVRSVRVIENGGRTITVTTTYEVRVDGRLVTLHMMVDEQGQLWSHLCPYQSFASATDLVRHLLRRLPHLFQAPPLPPSGSGGGGVGHPGTHDTHPAHGHGGAR
jgi:hypothetical protein